MVKNILVSFFCKGIKQFLLTCSWCTLKSILIVVILSFCLFVQLKTKERKEKKKQDHLHVEAKRDFQNVHRLQKENISFSIASFIFCISTKILDMKFYFLIRLLEVLVKKSFIENRKRCWKFIDLIKGFKN